MSVLQANGFSTAPDAAVASQFNGNVVQLVTTNGSIVPLGSRFSGASNVISLPVSHAQSSLALAQTAQTNLSTVSYRGANYRVLTEGDGIVDENNHIAVAVQVIRPLTDIQHTLSDLRLILWITTLGGHWRWPSDWGTWWGGRPPVRSSG